LGRFKRIFSDLQNITVDQNYTMNINNFKTRNVLIIARYNKRRPPGPLSKEGMPTLYEDIFEAIVRHQTDWNSSSEDYLMNWLKMYPIIQQMRTQRINDSNEKGADIKIIFVDCEDETKPKPTLFTLEIKTQMKKNREIKLYIIYM